MDPIPAINPFWGRFRLAKGGAPAVVADFTSPFVYPAYTYPQYAYPVVATPPAVVVPESNGGSLLTTVLVIGGLAVLGYALTR